ncbi:hypothetical protein [Burkholderia cenocepacia]|uniref:hypothetical protein n=1 Tax=Burkholderia cenocepacia TaxID=95486 RepID=UPI002118CCBD|nr:hypothetical protein [Burkholderia cenocepacia]
MHRNQQQWKNRMPECARMRKWRTATIRRRRNPAPPHHVYLPADIRTALAVGARYGVPAILEVAAQLMHRQGHTFFAAENDVWLIDAVPAEYLELIDTRAD